MNCASLAWRFSFQHAVLQLDLIIDFCKHVSVFVLRSCLAYIFSIVKEQSGAKLKVDLDPKPRHDAGLDIFPGIKQRAKSFSRWTYDLKIRTYVEPGEYLEVVK